MNIATRGEMKSSKDRDQREKISVVPTHYSFSIKGCKLQPPCPELDPAELH
jgi:hypothetical protein